VQLTGKRQPQFESLQALLLEMARERAIDRLPEVIVQRLARRKDVALARLWLVEPGDICPRCPMRKDCPDRRACLHLVASAGSPLDAAGADWSRTDGEFRRIPLGVGKIGRVASEGECLTVEDVAAGSDWIVRPAWAGAQGIRSFGGQPLRDGDQVLGVLAVFTRVRLDLDGRDWLRMIADHAAAAIVNARAFQELARRNRSLELARADLREQLDRAGGSGRVVGDGARVRDAVRGAEPVEGDAADGVVPDAELRRREKANVLAALEQTGWKIYGPGGAAELLGVKPTTLASRIRKMGLWKGRRAEA